MKKLFYGLLLVGGMFVLPHISFAAQVSDYVGVTSFSNTTNTIQIVWNKATSTLPSNWGIYLATGGVNPEPPLSYPGGGNPWFLNTNQGGVSNTGAGGMVANAVTNGGCAAGFDNYSSASSTNNVSSFSQVWNAVSSTYQNVSSLSQGIPLYLVLVSWDAGSSTCSTYPANYVFQDDEQVGSFVNTPVISFSFPVSATTTGDFNAWALNVQNVTSSDGYTIQVQYAASPQYLSINTFIDSSQYNFGVSTGLLSKSHQLINVYQSSTVWYATAFLYDTTLGNELVATSSQISFTVVNNGVYTFVTSSGGSVQVTTSTVATNVPNYIQNPVQNINETCTAPTSSIFSNPATYTGQSLAYGLCVTSVFLFVPSTNMSSWLQNSVTNIETVQPFQLVFGFITQVQTDVSTAPSENDFVWTANLGSANSAQPLGIITSSTLTTSFGGSNKSLIFQWEDYIFWLATVFCMAAEVYVFIRSIAGHKGAKGKKH